MQLELAPGAAVPLRYLNRHALITGATGTGKTVTLAALIEGLAGAGVPVLALDAKGDLESMGRVLCPYGDRGERAPLDLFRLGPEIMARALDLSEAQAGALYVLHAFAEAEGWPLATVQDLRDLCQHAAAHHRDISARFGLISPATLAAVQRGLFQLDPGAFGRPGLDMAGRSGVTIYAAARLARKPAQYAAAVAWLLLDLYERSPELGDLDRPALAVVIDESHLVFEGIPASLEKRLASVARLIRSKGVSLIWATQSPADLPPAIAGQCLTRVQHGLRAVTAQQLREVQAAADSLPHGFGKAGVEAILSLGVGEALVSLPDATGTPQPCQRVKITPGRIKPRPVAYFPAGLPAISPTGSAAISAAACYFPDGFRCNQRSRLLFPRRVPAPDGRQSTPGQGQEIEAAGPGQGDRGRLARGSAATWVWWHMPASFAAWTLGLVLLASLF